MAGNDQDRTDAMLDEIERLLSPVNEPHPYIGAGPDCRRCGRLDKNPIHTSGSQALNAMQAPHMCEKCGATFLSEEGFRKHDDRCLYICGLCDKQFSDRQEYQSHCWACACSDFTKVPPNKRLA